MTQTYHFGVPAVAVWVSHIIMGIFFVYLGYFLLTKMNKPNCSVPAYLSVMLIVLGVIGALYHAHIWWVDRNEKDDDNKKTK